MTDCILGNLSSFRTLQFLIPLIPLYDEYELLPRSMNREQIIFQLYFCSRLKFYMKTLWLLCLKNVPLLSEIGIINNLRQDEL